MANDPANITGRPKGLPRANIIEVLHGPGHGNGMAAIFAHNALRRACRATGIEDIERVLRVERRAIRSGSIGNPGRPIQEWGRQITWNLWPLETYHRLRFMICCF